MPEPTSFIAGSILTPIACSQLQRLGIEPHVDKMLDALKVKAGKLPKNHTIRTALVKSCCGSFSMFERFLDAAHIDDGGAQGEWLESYRKAIKSEEALIRFLDLVEIDNSKLRELISSSTENPAQDKFHSAFLEWIRKETGSISINWVDPSLKEPALFKNWVAQGFAVRRKGDGMIHITLYDGFSQWFIEALKKEQSLANILSALEQNSQGEDIRHIKDILNELKSKPTPSDEDWEKLLDKTIGAQLKEIQDKVKKHFDLTEQEFTKVRNNFGYILHTLADQNNDLSSIKNTLSNLEESAFYHDQKLSKALNILDGIKGDTKLIKRDTAEIKKSNQDIQRGIADLRNQVVKIRPAALPDEPEHCYGRDDLIRKITSHWLENESTFLWGGAGNGKTTTAQCSLHTPDTVDRFGEHRYYVDCRSSESYDLFVSKLARSLGASGNRKPRELLLGVLQDIPEGTAALLYLDNFETPWLHSNEQIAISDLLQTIKGCGNIILCASYRGSEHVVPQIGWKQIQIPPLENDFRALEEILRA